MKGAFIINKYYFDEGMEYVFNSLKNAFFDTQLIKISPDLILNNKKTDKIDFDFAIFFDKQINLASFLEKSGLKVFNNSKSLEICDDKIKTYLSLKDIRIPKTIVAPKMYDIIEKNDYSFLEFIENEIKYPIIVKENTGSQGRQVFKADNRVELEQIYANLKYREHHYQEFIGEFGADIRFFCVGHEVVASYKRKGTDFKSNLHFGGKASLFEPSQEYINKAQQISRMLNLDFGSIDFLVADEPIFLEANSNAYFKGVESLGVNVSKKIADYILRKVRAND